MCKMKKTLSLLLACLLLCLPLSSCLSHIEDTNGADDTSLVTLTDADIVKKTTSSITSSMIKKRVNGSCTVKVGKLSGVTDIETLTSDGDDVLTWTATLSSGNLRLCLVRDGEIVAELETDGNEHSLKLEEKGKYLLRAAGESAGFVIDFATDAKIKLDSMSCQKGNNVIYCL
ncbi:MAG: hypothetical protein MJ192_08370 [Clostridia bacterium]|nr:hypothetical protein [Clostridia bacterium]